VHIRVSIQNMSLSSAEILSAIPKWVKEADAGSLGAHADHQDKEVRKQVRKGLHQLRARGIEVPQQASRSWSMSQSDVGSLRHAISGEIALVQAIAPGRILLGLATPNEESGGELATATINLADAVIDASLYGQTDGQQQRLLRDFERMSGGRRPPLNWVKDRLRWSRDRALSSDATPPESWSWLLGLGVAPSQRPASFLVEMLDGVTPAAFSTETEILSLVGLRYVAPLFDLQDVADRIDKEVKALAGESNFLDLPVAERVRIAHDASVKAIVGVEQVAAALRGPLANLLEDNAVLAWLAQDDATSRRLLDEALRLRNSSDPCADLLAVPFVQIQIRAAMERSK
jgi:hypothetical protein